MFAEEHITESTSWKIVVNSQAGMVTAIYTGPYPVVPGATLPPITVSGVPVAVKDGAYQLLMKAVVTSSDDSYPGNDKVILRIPVLPI